jgi:hypothetical protein
MRNYSVIAPSFWTGGNGGSPPAIRALGPDVQVVALYAISCPSSTMIGLYYIPLPTLCHETGCSIEGATKALRSLGEIGFCYYNTESEQIWVPEMAKWQIGEQLDASDKRIKAIRRVIKQLGNSPFYSAFLDRYAEAFHLVDAEELPRGINAPSKPLRSQKQEQEQNQNQNQEQKNSCSERSSPPALPSAPNHSKQVAKTKSEGIRNIRASKKPTTQGNGEVVATIPLVDSTEAPVTEDIVAGWVKAYPAVNVRQKLSEIREWCMANPTRRKTAAGVGRFINAWLAREQDRGRAPDGNAQTSRRDRTGAPIPPARKTELRDTMREGKVIREEYDTETGQVIRSSPHPFAKGGKS